MKYLKLLHHIFIVIVYILWPHVIYIKNIVCFFFTISYVITWQNLHNVENNSDATYNKTQIKMQLEKLILPNLTDMQAQTDTHTGQANLAKHLY